MVVTTLPTSLKRRWSSSSNTMITSRGRIKISEEIILFFFFFFFARRMKEKISEINNHTRASHTYT
jgi:hypothetical protein